MKDFTVNYINVKTVDSDGGVGERSAVFHWSQMTSISKLKTHGSEYWIIRTTCMMWKCDRLIELRYVKT